MSGHSHAKTILHKKQITDAKRGKIFSKLAKTITIAAKEGGGNPDTNSKLRLTIDQAQSFNMPKENIERAIKKGAGELGGEKLEEFSFEAYGPGGIALLIEGITDNKNRTLGEIKQILNQHSGKLVESGVRWLFERKGSLILRITNLDELRMKSKEDLELAVIEAGADDIVWRDDTLEIYTQPENLESVKKNLEKKGLPAGQAGIKIESASIGWAAKEDVEVSEKDKESCGKLFEALDENDAVQEIYSNLKE